MTQTAHHIEAEEMRQQVNALVLLTYDADAQLTVEQLSDQVHADIERLRDADSSSRIELTTFEVKHIAEEAEIYGNERPPHFRAQQMQSYTLYRSALDSWEHYVAYGNGDAVELLKSVKDAEREFIKAHGIAS